VVVVGSDVKRYLEVSAGIPAPKISVIRNGVDVERYDTAPRTSRSACGLPDEGRLIGHVARFAAAKDQATLLRAFKRVLETYPDACLVLVGDGPLRSDLERLAHGLGIFPSVTFLGLRADVPEVLPHFEAVVFSSINEGLPLAILEAMAAGRPVVSTAVGEIPTVIDHGVAGLLVPPGDPELLADGVISLLERRGWAAELGRGARSVVESRFGVETSVAQYQALYRTLGRRADS
jgi:glycosyltransferase involved in cell wall biosynthesis